MTTTSPTLPRTPARSPLRWPAVLFMAVAAAVGTSTIYSLQPAMAEVAQSMRAGISAVGVALACGPVGYLLGLCLLVPLVDRCRPDRLHAGQFSALAAALALGAATGSPVALGAVVVAVGACSAVGAGLSSTSGRLAQPHRRAGTLGVVTAGISAGILTGRIVGGALTDQIGWRAMLLTFAGACVLIAGGCLLVLPGTCGTATRGYWASVRSLPGLMRTNRVLRIAAGRGTLWFFAFCTVWSGSAVALAQPPFSYSAAQIGLFALAGLAGVFVTPLAGSLTDRLGATRVVTAGLALAGLAAVGLAFGLGHTVVTAVCLALFDAGLFTAQVANQSTVLAIDPAAPARFNSAYMVVYFAGGSAGTAFGAVAVDAVGWTGAGLIAAGAIAVAAVVAPAARLSRRGPARSGL